MSATTTTTMRLGLGIALLLPLSAAGCGEKTGPVTVSPTTRVAVSVAPLSLPQVSDVGWTVTVRNDDQQVVWTRTLGSVQYGAGDGSVSYVGPCDATSNPNTVTLELASLTDPNGQLIPPSQYAAPPPLTKPVTCVPEGDVAVSFDVTVARAANQGFFDVAMTFSDVFCSAKLDCLNDQGGPLELLFDGDERGTTVIAAFACTSGGGQDTWLHMDAMILECSDGTRIVHNPSRGPGNVGGDDGPYVFQRAVYRGREQLEPYDKCYWNQAFGLDLDAIPAGVDCVLTGKATASEGAWVAGNTPEGAVWPVIRWEKQIVTDGALSCGRHALGQGPEVSIGYTDFSGERFFYSMECADEARAVPNGTACGGTLSGFGEQVVFAGTDEGVVLAVGSQVTDPMPLPPGVTLEDACCMDPCCSE